MTYIFLINKLKKKQEGTEKIFKMSKPVPAPRLSKQSDKRPVPTPRRTIPIRIEENVESVEIKVESPVKEMESTNTNTFTRKVKTISTASKQIAEDIGGKVQEGKKAVIEGTRQSVRRLTRRFYSQHVEDVKIDDKDKDDKVSEAELDLFNSIKFNSPIDSQLNENVKSSSEENLDLPPPTYPPPPLREEVSFYDEPQSLASGSTNSSDNPNRSYDYESVFPLYPYSSSKSSDTIDSSSETKASELSRSSSWNFYDPLPKSENIYNNVDNTPTLSVTHESNSSSADENIDSNCNSERYTASIIRTNSIYENHELNANHPRATQSVLMQFDPLVSNNEDQQRPLDDTAMLNDLKALEELLQGDLYNIISDNNTYDNWSISNESDFEIEYANPPTPPTRYDSLPSSTEPTSQQQQQPVVQTQQSVNKPEKEKSKSQFYVNAQETTTSQSTTKVEDSKAMKWLKKTQEVLRKAPDIVRGVRGKENYLQRPALISKNNIPQKGMLYKITMVENLFGEYGGRWCVLEGNNLICYFDNTCDTIKEHFTMNSILSVQIIIDQKYKYR